MPAVLLVICMACSPGAAPTGGDPPEDPTDAVLESRAALGEPMLALAESIIGLADGLREARHTVARGDAMQDVVEVLPDRQDEVRNAALDAVEAATRAPVAEAAAIVETAAERAEHAVAAADGEIAFLRRLTAVDAVLLDTAGQWDRAGSQSEIRTRLDDAADRVGSLRATLREIEPRPRRCTALLENRREWIATVRQRTMALQAEANSAGGTRYDQLRGSYRALPLGVEPRSADRADRRCWSESSAVARAEQEMRTAVEDLQEELSGPG